VVTLLPIKNTKYFSLNNVMAAVIKSNGWHFNVAMCQAWHACHLLMPPVLSAAHATAEDAICLNMAAARHLQTTTIGWKTCGLRHVPTTPMPRTQKQSPKHKEMPLYNTNYSLLSLSS
jgi:hypothetical protein